MGRRGRKIWLEGEDPDLMLLEDLFPDRGYIHVARDKQGWYMTAPDLDTLFSEPSMLFDAARELLDMVNGVATLTYGSFSSVRLTGQFSEDAGTRHAVILVPSIVSRVRVPSPTIIIDGQVQPRVSPAQMFMEVALADPDVAEVLRLSAGPLDWVSMYKVWEIIRDN